MEWMYPRIGERIKALRKSRDLTQAHLAEKVGLSRTSIVNIEQGHQKVMIHVLYQLADVFGLPVADLIPAFNEASPMDQVKAGALEKDALAFFEQTVGKRLQEEGENP